ncbi:cytochrome c biogenesis CcdA family protein [Pseudoroseicyclus sp. H15]
MDPILAYLAGLLTLINPCILPVLPIVLASAAQQGEAPTRLGPVWLAAGMSVSFVALGLVLSRFGPALGITPELVARAAALVMAAFGAMLLIPRLSAGFATATAGLATRADAAYDARPAGPLGQALGGALLGAVWVPCIGPTLGAAIALASTGGSLWQAGVTMAFFALGVSTIIVLLAYGAQSAIRARKARLQAIATRARPIMGAIFLALGLALFFNLHLYAEGWLLSHMPIWLQDLSVRF